MSKVNPLTFMSERDAMPSLGQVNVWSNSWKKAEKLAVDHFGQVHGSPASRGLYALAKGASSWGSVGRELLKDHRYLEKSKSRGDWLGLAVCSRVFKLDDVASLAVEAFVKGEEEKPSLALSPDEIDELAGCVRIVARSMFLEPPLARVLSLDVASPAVEKAGVSVPDLLAKPARGGPLRDERAKPSNPIMPMDAGGATERGGATEGEEGNGFEEAKILMARALELMGSRPVGSGRPSPDVVKTQEEFESLRREVERLRKELLESRQATHSALSSKHEAEKGLNASRSRCEELERKCALLACENTRLRGQFAQSAIDVQSDRTQSAAGDAFKEDAKMKSECDPYESESESEYEDAGDEKERADRDGKEKLKTSGSHSMEIEKLKNDMLRKARTGLRRCI